MAPLYNFNSKNQITGYTYDADGNQTYDGTYYYTYDAENRLVKVGTSSGANNVGSYGYDALGQRVTQTNSSGSYEFLFDLQGHEVADIAPTSGTVYTAEVYAGGRHWVTDNGQAYFMHTDWLGTGRVWTNVSGAVAATCTNLPFGDSINCSGSVSRTHFTGETYDTESGLTHFPFRQYDNTQGRWMHPDPAGLAAVDITNPQTWNRYAYVTNNPVSYVDPLGLDVDADGCNWDDDTNTLTCPTGGGGGGGWETCVDCVIGGGGGAPGDGGGGGGLAGGGGGRPKNCTPGTKGCYNVPTAQQQCVAAFHNTTIGGAAQFGSVLSLVPGLGSNVWGAATEWVVMGGGKWALLNGVRYLSSAFNDISFTSVITGSTIAPAAPAAAAADTAMGLATVAGPYGIGAATGLDLAAQAGCYAPGGQVIQPGWNW